ncbi:hypothetical protein K0M31_011157 [Melipona bicolor]|uniref:Uncharacterized protein n=1 Tax=Melipona bicolor TaxID=60889 RepID=A0AA40KUH7_9HYME|nr:hypothetical protein K0M31_011157 [Melipona bicolor]
MHPHAWNDFKDHLVVPETTPLRTFCRCSVLIVQSLFACLSRAASPAVLQWEKGKQGVRPPQSGRHCVAIAEYGTLLPLVDASIIREWVDHFIDHANSPASACTVAEFFAEKFGIATFRILDEKFEIGKLQKVFDENF